ncbi:glycosyltransferase family 4 protein [Herminiimonas sp. CN]|uniref:glycosyltransferase family 4 protein n=1 Tax=Herminiimonas sp. CN TaxID=1349818 RepID=UPI0004742D79|nr:glycosyltransferase family 4 protein [Herminiimonas sp. CN]
MMLKVLFICPTVACYIGGTETVVSQLSQCLKDQVQLTVLSGDIGQEKRNLIHAEGFELLTIPFVGRDLRLNQLLSKILMTSRFKIESYSFFRSLAQSQLDLSQYDCIATFYEADAYLLARRHPSLQDRCIHFLPGVSLRRFFKRVPATKVFFFGYRAAPRTKKRWGITIPSLPLGVDSTFFSDRVSVYPETKRLVYIGRLDKSKHIDWLADFFAESGLAERGYHLDIVGDGPLLEVLSVKYGTSRHMTLHGKKRQEDVAGILQHSFLLLHPTDLESFGLTILEAMAAGVPVITHDLPSIRTWAHDHPRYANFLDQSSWANEITKFEDPSYWAEVSTANLAYAKSFTWGNVAEQVLDIIRSQTRPALHP